MYADTSKGLTLKLKSLYKSMDATRYEVDITCKILYHTVLQCCSIFVLIGLEQICSLHLANENHLFFKILRNLDLEIRFLFLLKG